MPAGIAELALLAGLGWWPGQRFPWPGILVFWAAFIIYGFAARRIVESEGGELPIWIFAVLMRLVLVPLAPHLSDDIYRYLWDGHVQLSGINPFRYAPADPALVAIRTPWHALINNPTVPTIYPPFAQMAFLFIALVGGTIFQAKLLWLGFDLGTGWLLGRLARITGRSRRLTQLLYLWSPLLIVEVAWSGHLEPLGIFGLVLMLLLARAPLTAGVAGALSTLTKFAPAAALPSLARRLGRRFLIGFAVTSVALYLPYVTAGPKLFAGLGTYARHWRFMEGPYRLLEAVVPGALGPRIAAALIVLAVVAWTTAWRFRPERALFWILGAGLLVTPTLHPWYVLWILPLAALRVSRPWLLLSGLVFVGYFGFAAYHRSGVWPQPTWARLVLWLPVGVLLVIDGLRAWRKRFPGPVPLSQTRES